MYLASDRAVNTFSRWARLAHIIEQIDAEKIRHFQYVTETIGAIMIWPSSKIDGKSTINSERGFNRKISDRLDLTIECIRLYYLGQTSPLYDTFSRYADFFELFGDFRGYVDFFLLQDFVSSDYMSVKIAPPFDGFASMPVPANAEEYYEYMKSTIQLVTARNKRLDRH